MCQPFQEEAKLYEQRLAEYNTAIQKRRLAKGRCQKLAHDLNEVFLFIRGPQDVLDDPSMFLTSEYVDALELEYQKANDEYEIADGIMKSALAEYLKAKKELGLSMISCLQQEKLSKEISRVQQM